MAVSTNLGRVGLCPKGDYSASATYKRLDFVVYSGSSYVALKDNLKGVTPGTNAGSWQLLAAGTGQYMTAADIQSITR